MAKLHATARSSPPMALAGILRSPGSMHGCRGYERTQSGVGAAAEKAIKLGSVEIHREFITAAARWMFAAKL
jgi:hypothetical protein